MILIDFTQTVIAGMMAQLKVNDGEVSEDLVRHMILNSLRNYQKRYQSDYGEMVLCTDSAHTWRKDFYPLYKANRKKAREQSDLDWQLIFDTLHKVKMEIKDNFPYRYMYVESAEADDIIAILTKHATEDVLIISGDKDFQQLQKYDYVTQWSPNLNRFVECENPSLFLKEHILKGDKSDGVPNILSRDDVFDTGVRQTPLRKNILTTYLRIDIQKDDKYYRNYLRNQTLIDLEFIPEDLEKKILIEYDKNVPVKGKVFDYLRTHRLNELLNHAEDFKL